ncbi:hypothetical protein Y023_5253 [Burkholderia pseudomallei A79D]|nr:hypothetical protein X992_5221 [Burkholderia pseudomallei MSHR5492]KGS84540.1 hypothetical protein X976_4740 [Burkholderia pseudomallei MSHR7500]KGX95830.1 hypothetical protein Y023_5253 [Burkholderia pseudomallei A79D]KGX96913.1 hypothetical protein X997_4933 [Burkholderia pseudomallei A79C]
MIRVSVLPDTLAQETLKLIILPQRPDKPVSLAVVRIFPKIRSGNLIFGRSIPGAVSVADANV